MNEQEVLFKKGRSLIETLVNHPTNPLPLDYSLKSLDIVHSFVASLNEDSLSEVYVGRMLLTMAIYVGDMLKQRFPDAIYEIVFADKEIKDVVFKFEDNTLFLLNMMRKAMMDPDGSNIALKFPFLVKQLEGKLNLVS